MFSCSKDDDGDGNQLIPGMGSPITEKSDNYNITYQYEDSVLVLNNKTLRYLSKVVEDSILYFLPETPDSIMPKVGTIISSHITDKTPYGLGNVVISKEEEDGLVKFVTTVAPLNKTFKILDVESNFSIADLLTNKDGFYDDDGTYYEINIKDADDIFTNTGSARWNTRGSIGSNKIIEIPIKKETSSGFYSEFKLMIGGIFTFNTKQFDGIFELSLEPSIGIEGELGFKKDGKEYPKDDEYKKIIDLIKKKRLFEGTLKIGVITLRPFIDFEAAVVGRTEAKAAVGFSHYASIKFGWNEEGWINKNTSQEPTIESIFNKLELNSRLEIGPQLTFYLGCGFYTTSIAVTINAKPALLFGADLGVKGTVGKQRLKMEGQKLTLDFVTDIEAAAYVNLGLRNFEKKRDLARINLYNWECPIFPELESNSLKINARKDYPPLTFDASYSLTGGLLSKILNLKPALNIYENEREILSMKANQDIYARQSTTFEFELNGLEKNTKYTAVPCIMWGDQCFEWQGKDFIEENNSPCIDDNHPHMIDLGLPSGTKWSCCNLGASKPEEYGAYYDYNTAMTKSIPTWTQCLELQLYTTSSLDKGWDTYTSSNGQSIILPYAGWTLNGKPVGVGSSYHIWFSVDDDPNAFPVGVWGWNPGLSVPEGDTFVDKFSIRTVSKSN